MNSDSRTGRLLRTCRPKRFTLIEMLIVVAIIGLLAALLMPALHSALESGRTVGCASSQRQTQLLIFAYMEANNGRQPGQYIYVPTTVSPNGHIYWYAGLYDYQGSDSKQLFYCPVMRDRYAYKSGSVDHALVNYYRGNGSANMDDVRPLALCRTPARVAQLFDCAIFQTFDWAGSTFYQVPASARIWWNANQSLGDWRHGGGVTGPGYYGIPKYLDGVCNAVFLDGHQQGLRDGYTAAERIAMQRLQ